MLRRASTARPPGGSEFLEQCAFIEWCALQGKRYPWLELGYHPPNGGLRPSKYVKRRGVVTRVSIEAIKLTRLGAKRGVLDWHLPVPLFGWHSLWIEFKYGGNVLTDEQRKFAAALSALKHQVHVCRSAEEGIAAIRGYYAGIPAGMTLFLAH